MQDLKDVTHDIHYENYRAQKLAGGNFNPAKMIKVDDRYVFCCSWAITNLWFILNNNTRVKKIIIVIMGEIYADITVIYWNFLNTVYIFTFREHLNFKLEHRYILFPFN